MRNRHQFLLLSFLAAPLLSCSSLRPIDMSGDPGTGPNPLLPPPRDKLIPTVDIAPAVGWPAGAAPQPSPDLRVRAFATGLDHPRSLYVLPNGDVLVAETNAPANPEGPSSIKGLLMKAVMTKAGAAVPSANRITLLRDADGDGVAELSTAFLTGLHSPFGMALVGDTLYVANTDAVVRFPYRTGQTEIEVAPVKVADLPAGPINYHWTKAMVASRDGSTLYVGVGSNSNVAENGMKNEDGRAVILEVDTATRGTRVHASGLRNPSGLDLNPQDGQLWAVVNERDELGDNLVPDYLVSVREGGFYGWPYSYFGQVLDTRVEPRAPALVATALVPDYALGSHVAPLGLAFYDGDALPSKYRGGAFIGMHGSWNRSPPVGYKVVFLPFDQGKPSGQMQTVLDRFVNTQGQAQGRPVDLAVGRDGALLVADDVGNTVWWVGSAMPAR